METFFVKLKFPQNGNTNIKALTSKKQKKRQHKN